MRKANASLRHMDINNIRTFCHMSYETSEFGSFEFQLKFATLWVCLHGETMVCPNSLRHSVPVLMLTHALLLPPPNHTTGISSFSMLPYETYNPKNHPLNPKPWLLIPPFIWYFMGFLVFGTPNGAWNPKFEETRH